MVMFLFFILLLLLLIILLVIIAFFFLWIWGGYKSKVPFIPISYSALKHILENIEIDNKSIVYDLGCGDGRVLFYLSKQYPNAKYIGLEINLLAVFLSRIGSWWNKKQTGNSVTILHQDFFKKNLSDATHIFTYLFPETMDNLLPKLENELKPGTKLISATFQFKNKRPTAEIDLKRKKHKLIRKLYVYVF